jgi:arabinan endo-1,5-alpha-L-arabinosidase
MPATHNSIKTYTNPVYKRDFPDPGVLRTEAGLYTYATQSLTPNGMHNIQVAFSRDGIHWEGRGDALPIKSSWAAKQDYWAPHVIFKDGTYFMFYNAKKDKSGHAISVATSRLPEGPFVDNGQPLVTGWKFINIDAFIFHDKQQARWWLCWGSCHKPIKMRELDASLLKFAAGSRTIEILAAEKHHAFARLHEASWIHERFDPNLQKTFYYLFTSGADAFGLDSYGLMVARSERLTGPFETLAQAKNLPDSVILRSNATFLNPGAHSIFTDDEGQDWLLYHAYSRADVQMDYKKIHSFPRMMMLDALHYDESGWPCVETGSPSVGLQKGPTFFEADAAFEAESLGAVGK